MASSTDNPTDKPSDNPSVDTTPISPTLERQTSLEKHLQTRPEEKDLKNRHILLDTTAAPALQARAAELERQRITDNLKKGLSKRSGKEELVESMLILSLATGGEAREDYTTAAPGLQAQQRELQKHMRANSLEKQLQSRPNPEDLVKGGILQKDESPLADS
ncbi:hypothetical protein B0A48_18063 [Cryoendolithus antarcticus]|uniref:RPEL repeat protein n=1 Tax=Cryoendolithus antarcticus TaxID=1507870 RepID=A0A1V8SAB6_9PEZI|nr:hypothetical protein B0A48_18063 [Cryoendolithus antarcticus]